MNRCSLENSYLGEDPHPTHPLALTPIPPSLPPHHTQIKPRCFTCSHFKMCAYKRDYLKTITIIQNSLGAPARNFELTQNYLQIPDYIGFPMPLWSKHLPKEVVFNNAANGVFFGARFNGINNMNIVYTSGKHYILIKLKYSEETKLYELKSSKEAFYRVDFALNKDSLEEIQIGLIDWRDWIINQEAPALPPKKDIINTTHFSSELNCDMYEWNKVPYEDSIKKLLIQYPQGIPIDEKGNSLYHIATFHTEDGEVPYSPLLFEKKSSSAAKNYVKPHSTKKEPITRRRGDL